MIDVALVLFNLEKVERRWEERQLIFSSDPKKNNVSVFDVHRHDEVPVIRYSFRCLYRNEICQEIEIGFSSISFDLSRKKFNLRPSVRRSGNSWSSMPSSQSAPGERWRKIVLCLTSFSILSRFNDDGDADDALSYIDYNLSNERNSD